MNDNFFALFEVAEQLDLDAKLIEQRFRALTFACHPDRLRNSSPKERIEAASRAAKLNEGFAVLKDPERRAMHLLALRGIELDAETNAAVAADPNYLAQVLEQREELEAAQQRQDTAKVEELRLRVKREHDESFAKLLQLTKHGDWRAAAQALIQMRYASKFLADLRVTD